MDRICIAAAGSTRALMADGPGDVLIVTFDDAGLCLGRAGAPGL